MYPNLLGQKAYYHLSAEDMGAIIGTSRNTFEQKMKSGRFTPKECKAYCEHFGKTFDFLFATDDELFAEKNEKSFSPRLS